MPASHYFNLMRKNMYLLLTFIAWLSVLPLSAQQVSLETARLRASTFLAKTPDDASSAKKAPRRAPQLSLVNTNDEVYIFNDEANDSHVIISSDERMPEVLGFSYEGTIDPAAIPCNMQAWLDACSAQVRWLRDHPEVVADRRKSPQRADIAPMLTCKFSQRTPYNLKCPEVNGQHCVTGCTATAMAQITYYHQWPKKTTFTIPAYTTNTLKIEIPETPPTTIEWSKIPDRCSVNSSAEEQDAVSTLLALCGAAVKMDYTLSGSGAFSLPEAYDLLDYDMTSMQRVVRSNYSDADWEEMLYNELKQKRPIDYGGYSESGDHAFVIDGYRYIDNTAYWHVNWGWGGSYVATGPYYNQQYYTLDNMSYNNNQSALIGIQPASNVRAYAVDEAGGKTTLYYDTEVSNKGNKVRSIGSVIGSDVTEVEFHPSFANFKPKQFTFLGCKNLKQIKGIEYLNTEDITDMRRMFYACESLTSLNLSHFNTANVTDMSSMFSGCNSLTSLNLSSFNTVNVTDMGGMFSGCSSLTSLNLSSFNTANVSDMGGMFSGCSSLTSLNLSSFNTANVINMESMFSSCNSFTSLELSSFNTANVTDMNRMFMNCSSITTFNLSHFNTANVTDMSWMFGACRSLTSLDLSNFNTANVTDMSGMFFGCWDLVSIEVSNLWDVSNVTNGESMFYDCTTLRGGAGTVYDANNVGLSYAHVDGGTSNPGYLTYKAATGIKTLGADANAPAQWFTLDGKRLYGEPFKKGIYIRNGKKIVVK